MKGIRQNRILALTMLLAWHSLLLFAQQTSDWTFKNEKDGVKVYYRTTGDVHEVKLTTSIQTTTSGLIHLLSDVEAYPSWGYKIAESRLIKYINENEMIYYSRVDFPWPLNDRDVVLYSKFHQNPVTRVVTGTSTAVSGHLPPYKNIVRMNTCVTTWTVYPPKGGWSYVEYTIYSKPGGSLPDWMVNMAIDMGPRETIKAIRKQIKLPKYQQIRLAHIKED
jgi:START domain